MGAVPPEIYPQREAAYSQIHVGSILARVAAVFWILHGVTMIVGGAIVIPTLLLGLMASAQFELVALTVAFLAFLAAVGCAAGATCVLGIAVLYLRSGAGRLRWTDPVSLRVYGVTASTRKKGAWAAGMLFLHATLGLAALSFLTLPTSDATWNPASNPTSSNPMVLLYIVGGLWLTSSMILIVAAWAFTNFVRSVWADAGSFGSVRLPGFIAYSIVNFAALLLAAIPAEVLIAAPGWTARMVVGLPYLLLAGIVGSLLIAPLAALVAFGLFASRVTRFVDIRPGMRHVLTPSINAPLGTSGMLRGAGADVVALERRARELEASLADLEQALLENRIEPEDYENRRSVRSAELDGLRRQLADRQGASSPVGPS